jgi:hypothetical protein
MPAVPPGSAYRWVALPPDFNPTDCTIAEAASFRRESRWMVHQKLNAGIYQSYLDGRIRKIIFASVKADRERAMKMGRGVLKKVPGRPRKKKAEPVRREMAEVEAAPAKRRPALVET